MLFTLVKSLPGLVNIAMLLGLIIFIYAIIGMSSFGYVKKSNGITDVVNFETFGNSMLLLFRVGTAAGWNTILDPLMVSEPDCDPNMDNGGPNGNCGNRFLAVFFFVSYILIIFLIMINMYIAVILENFNEAQQQEEIGVTDDDLETFIQVWEEFDPKATHYIHVNQLSDFLAALEPPLQVPKPNRHLFGELQVPLKTGYRIYLVDLMQVLVRRAMGGVEGHEEHEMVMLVDRLEERFANMRKKETDLRSLPEQHKFEIKAAVTIQKAIRIFLLKRRLRVSRGGAFHAYDELTSEKGKAHGWKEKQVEDNTRVIGMLWLSQAKRHEEESTTDAQDEDEENTKDEENTEDDSPTEVTVVDQEKPKPSPNTLSVHC